MHTNDTEMIKIPLIALDIPCWTHVPLCKPQFKTSSYIPNEQSLCHSPVL